MFPWRIRYDYRGLNAITEPLVKPLTHIDALWNKTSGAAQWLQNSNSRYQVRTRSMYFCGS